VKSGGLRLACASRDLSAVFAAGAARGGKAFVQGDENSCVAQRCRYSVPVEVGTEKPIDARDDDSGIAPRQVVEKRAQRVCDDETEAGSLKASIGRSRAE